MQAQHTASTQHTAQPQHRLHTQLWPYAVLCWDWEAGSRERAAAQRSRDLEIPLQDRPGHGKPQPYS
eukprot:COSAG01_NODE_2691_length_7244_cov_143.957465_6_plen_67_part_00